MQKSFAVFTFVLMLIFGLLWEGCSNPTAPNGEQVGDGGPNALAQLQETIGKLQAKVSSKRITDDGNWLTSDKYKGRNNSTDASKLTQKELIRLLKEMGLQPVGGKFEHSFGGRAPGVNILAELKGKDPKLAKEVVVIGGHYDHLGPRKDGKIYHGASDNALGVAIVLELARILTSGDFKPSRTVIFAFWDSEEDGLQGSNHALKDNHIPVKQVITYINVDIAGANLFKGGRDFHLVLGAESGSAQLEAMVDRQIKRPLKDIEPLRLGIIFGQARSDYLAFINNDIPSLFFSDSTNIFYHTVHDTMANANLPKTIATAKLMLGVLLEVTESKDPPVWNEKRFKGNSLAAFGVNEAELKNLMVIGKRVMDNASKIGLKAQEIEKLKTITKRMQSVIDSGKVEEEDPLPLLLETVLPIMNMLIKYDPGK